jgi:GGDEF domain-containing protein
MGGDEFLNLLEVSSEDELVRLVSHWKDRIEATQPKKPYRTDASVGWGLYGKPGQTFDGFLRQIDKMMYAEKARKQALDDQGR